MGVIIKQLTEGDWQALRSIRLKALQSDPSVFGSNYQKESAYTESDWKKMIQNKNTAIFLLYEDDAPIGMTGISIDREDPTKKRANLWGSWLEPHARRRGLSKTMYLARISWAREHPSIEKIIVSHRASNLSSRYANQKHGFIFTHKLDKIWPDGTQDEHIFYALDTKPSLPPDLQKYAQ
jgi:RimJ/RimL family protein N-acetyltransferase